VQGELAAGDFSVWLSGMQAALRGEAASDVPCGGCTACCRAAQFIHIEPDEADTLAHIPAELLVPVPRRPPGHVVLGYDERGHCPMLTDAGCSIYAHRPRACRTYDCRVFPAAGVLPGDDAQVDVARRAARWRFTHPAPADRADHDAVCAAAAYLAAHRSGLPADVAPANETQLAVAAVVLHDQFLTPTAPEPDAVVVTLRRRAE
jgi:Fe-S-cluster containining protein